MEQINMNVIWGLVSVAILGGVSLAAKDTIGNMWSGVSFMLNPNMRRGSTIEAKIQGELIKGEVKGVGLNRVMVKDQQGCTHLILISDLKKATVKVYPREK